MSPQESQQKIEELNSSIGELKNNFNVLQTILNQFLNSPTRLNTNLDQTSKDTINKVFRQNFLQVSVIVGAGFTLLPQSQYIKVSGTASRTSSTATAIANGTWYGQTILIEGTDNTKTIIIKDTANTQLAGDCTLGIYDTLTVWWNGTYWIEQCRSNN